MYSVGFVELASMASAGRAKRCVHSGRAMNCRRGRMRVGRGWGGELEEEERVAGRWRSSGRRRWPRGKPWMESLWFD